MTNPSDIRNIAVVGHKGSGKTSLVEAMLQLVHATPKRSTRDAEGHFLDATPEERAHHATLESRLSSLHWRGAKINVVDTPGDAAALGDTRLALGAVDAAVFVISARDGVQSGTERVFRWASESGMPCVVALSRVDDDLARTDETVREIREKLHLPLAVLTLPVGRGKAVQGICSVLPRRAWMEGRESERAKPVDPPPSEEEALTRARAQLAEDVAVTDEKLTERYLTDGDLCDEDILAGLRGAVKKRAVVPLFSLASTRPMGLLALLDAIVDVVPAPDAHPEEPLEAFVWKTHVDPHTGRASYTRVFSGVLHVDDAVVNANTGQKERVGQLLEGSDKDAHHVPEAVAGDIVSVSRLKTTHTGETLSDQAHPRVHTGPSLPPRLFSRAVLVDSRALSDRALAELLRLAEEDPSLSVSHDEVTHDLVISGHGASHLDLAVERLRDRSGIECRLGPPRVAYRETITQPAKAVEGKQKKQTGGHGQYGVCYIDVLPLERGQGFVFEDAIVGGVIPRQFIGSVQKGVERAMQRGPLAGYPVVDVQVRLFDGKTHSVDSSDAAFQAAGFRAMRAALAAASPTLIEPVMLVEATVPIASLGDVMGDLNSRGGHILGTDAAHEATLVRASVPFGNLLDFEPRLTAMTHGRGSYNMTFERYQVVPAQAVQRVVAESNYKGRTEEE